MSPSLSSAVYLIFQEMRIREILVSVTKQAIFNWCENEFPSALKFTCKKKKKSNLERVWWHTLTVPAT
jgi:hypothetical protein